MNPIKLHRTVRNAADMVGSDSVRYGAAIESAENEDWPLPHSVRAANMPGAENMTMAAAQAAEIRAGLIDESGRGQGAARE